MEQGGIDKGKRVRGLILLAVGAVLMGLRLWTLRTEKLQRREAVAIAADIERTYTPEDRPAPLLVQTQLFMPDGDDVDFPPIDGTRIFKYSGGMDSVRLTLVGETKARSHCFDVTYGVDGPADVRTYSCPNGPPLHF